MYLYDFTMNIWRKLSGMITMLQFQSTFSGLKSTTTVPNFKYLCNTIPELLNDFEDPTQRVHAIVIACIFTVLLMCDCDIALDHNCKIAELKKLSHKEAWPRLAQQGGPWPTHFTCTGFEIKLAVDVLQLPGFQKLNHVFQCIAIVGRAIGSRAAEKRSHYKHILLSTSP